MRRWMVPTIWAAALLVTLSSAAMAQDSGGGADDAGASLIRGAELLKQVFGLDATSLATLISSPDPTILAAISTVFTLFAVTFIVIVVLITFFSGTMQQGADGVVLGRRYSTLWVPLRAVLAFFYIVPLASGYAIIQILIVWAGGWSDWVGNKAWNETVTFMENNAVVAGVPMPPRTRETVEKMFLSAMCAERISQIAEENGESLRIKHFASEATYTPAPEVVMKQYVWEHGTATGYDIRERDPLRTVGLHYSGEGVFGGDGSTLELCGSISVTRETGSVANNYTAVQQQENLNALADELTTIARDAVRGQGVNEDIRNRLVMAEARYARSERDRAITYAAMTQDEVLDARVTQLEHSRNAGWISAGAWYMTFAGISEKIMNAITLDLNYVEPTYDQMPASMKGSIRNQLAKAAILTRPGLLETTTQQSASLPSQMNSMGWELGGRTQGRNIYSFVGELERPAQTWTDIENLLKRIDQNFRGSNPASWLLEAIGPERTSDSVVVLQQLGHRVLSIAEAGLAFGMLGAPFGLLPVAFGIVSPFLVGGGALAYYLPMLPYIYWVMGVAGWLLLLAEAVAIAPLFAAMHALPEGEGWAGQYARHGYILVLNILVRPLLMIFGFVGGILMMNALSSVLGVTMKWAIDATQGAYYMGIASMIAYFVIAVGLYIAIARMSFSLIHVVPDRALRWVNSHDSIGDLGGERHTTANALIVANAVVGQLGRLFSRGRRTSQSGGLPPARFRRD